MSVHVLQFAGHGEREKERELKIPPLLPTGGRSRKNGDNEEEDFSFGLCLLAQFLALLACELKLAK